MAFIANLLLLTSSQSLAIDRAPPKLTLLSVQKIWDRAPHNAFTDLVDWRGRVYCAFREGESHAGNMGQLRVIASNDGSDWQSTGLLSLPPYDLRDAALSVTPDDRLMLMGGAQLNLNDQRATGTFVSFSEDGHAWTQPQIVVPPGRWLWRVTWQGDAAYGVTYPAGDETEYTSLLRTRDGLHFDVVARQLLSAGGRPTEARIRFDKDGTAYCLHRRDGTTGNSAFLGRAAAPYKSWQWTDLGLRLGGPNFIESPLGPWLAAGRLYEPEPRTEVAWLDLEQQRLQPVLRLPSGGDTSYPGMLWRDGELWISYYSSHEGRTNIYLARIEMSSD
jgi:hypothetical protein